MIAYQRRIHTHPSPLDRCAPGGQDLSAMWFKRPAQVLILLVGFCFSAFGQGYKSEIEAPEKVSLVVKNLDGRVSVIASEEQQKKVTIDAKSTGAAVAPEDIKVESKGSDIHIDVRPRGEKNRIDLVVTIPTRSKVEVEGQRSEEHTSELQ